MTTRYQRQSVLRSADTARVAGTSMVHSAPSYADTGVGYDVDDYDESDYGEMQQEIMRSLMEGVLVVVVMAGVSGQPVLSRQVLTTGLIAGLGLYVIDSFAPNSSAAIRFATARGVAA